MIFNEIVLKNVSNGVIIEHWHEEELPEGSQRAPDLVPTEIQVFEETSFKFNPHHDLRNLQGVLYTVMNALGYHGSKHDQYRLVVKIVKQDLS